MTDFSKNTQARHLIRIHPVPTVLVCAFRWMATEPKREKWQS